MSIHSLGGWTPASSVGGPEHAPLELPPQARADADTGRPSGPGAPADRAPPRFSRFWGLQRLRASQRVATSAREDPVKAIPKVTGFENGAYRGPQPLSGRLPAALGPTVRQQAEALYAIGVRAPALKHSADQLVGRMARPTGLSGWLTGLLKPKKRSVAGLAMSLAAPTLASLPKHLESGLRRSVSAEICKTVVSQAFDALDERGKQRWIRRTTATRGAFAATLRHLDRRCVLEQGQGGPGPERHRVMRDLLNAMRELPRTASRGPAPD